MTQWTFSFCGYPFVLTTKKWRNLEAVWCIWISLWGIYWWEMAFSNNLAWRANYFQVGMESFLGYLNLNYTKIDVVMVDIDRQLGRTLQHPSKQLLLVARALHAPAPGLRIFSLSLSSPKLRKSDTFSPDSLFFLSSKALLVSAPGQMWCPPHSFLFFHGPLFFLTCI